MRTFVPGIEFAAAKRGKLQATEQSGIGSVAILLRPNNWLIRCSALYYLVRVLLSPDPCGHGIGGINDPNPSTASRPVA